MHGGCQSVRTTVATSILDTSMSILLAPPKVCSWTVKCPYCLPHQGFLLLDIDKSILFAPPRSAVGHESPIVLAHQSSAAGHWYVFYTFPSFCSTPEFKRRQPQDLWLWAKQTPSRTVDCMHAEWRAENDQRMSDFSHSKQLKMTQMFLVCLCVCACTCMCVCFLPSSLTSSCWSLCRWCYLIVLL